MITPDVLLPLWEAHRGAIDHRLRTLELAGRVLDDRPYQLGVINLSRDSTYRESIAYDVPAALYRARRMTVEGALLADGLLVSVETYLTDAAFAALEAGAGDQPHRQGRRPGAVRRRRPARRRDDRRTDGVLRDRLELVTGCGVARVRSVLDMLEICAR